MATCNCSIETEIARLDGILSEKSRLYQFDEAYDNARSRVTLLRNPVINFELWRRQAIVSYLGWRRSGATAENKRFYRQSALRDLAHTRAVFKDLGLFPHHTKEKKHG